jgi:hypothetical protein
MKPTNSFRQSSSLETWFLRLATIALLLFTLWFAHECLWVDGKPSLQNLGVAVGWGGSFLIGLLGLVVVYRMFDGSIDLTRLISEPTGEASMSRFQLLIFTFVIGMSLLLITVSHSPGGPAFPSDIASAILGLLGISAGSYVVAKGIQKDITMARLPPTVTVSCLTPDAVPEQTVAFTAAVTGAGELSYQWQRLSPGSVSPQDLPGQTSASLTVKPSSVSENGTQYRCKVSSEVGEAISNFVTLNIHPDRG